MDWLPQGHLAYFVLEVVRELDLGAIEAAIQQKDPHGERPSRAGAEACVRAGLKTMGHVSLDGSKVHANASKHEAMSDGRAARGRL